MMIRLSYNAVIILIINSIISNSIYSQNSFRELEYSKIPVPFTGKVIDAYEIKDKDGQHLLLITKKIDSVLFETSIVGAKYSKTQSGFIKRWEVKDRADEIAFHFPYTRIVDIDKDGRFETVFTYQLNPDDGEGSDWKVILHYNNKKYVLRAHVPVLDFDKYKVTLDKSFDKSPKQLKSYIKNYWAIIVKMKDLKTS
jgi:hypothetical protein